MSARVIASRILCPLLLLVLAASQLAIGGNALPTWLAVLLQKSDLDPLTWLRVLIMLEVSFALFILFLGRGPGILLSHLALICIAFVSLAECAAAVRSQNLASVVISASFFTLAAALELVLLRGHPKTTREDGPTRRASPVAKIIASTLVVVSVAIAANAQLAPRTLTDGAVANREAPTETNSRIIEMTPTGWVGRSLRETPIGQFVPDVIDLMEDDGILVLYNPRCGTCHDLFDVYFSGDDMELPIVALEVPPTDTAVLVESEYSEDVDCPTCEFTSLPNGPMWLVGVPYVIRVVDEVVTCVGKDAPEGCLDD
ncbi:MAG: hypothetical protein VX641_01410 [Planctomycetota bacterium]|nr:hypothetical protein [Planctomycetota bacterium]